MSVHHVAPVTVALGTVLDCTIGDGDTRVFVDEWEGFHLLTNEGAFSNAPGRARLYFVRGKLAALPAKPQNFAGSKDFKYWSSRDPDRMGELDTKPCKYVQGRLLRLGYRSDKWHRKGKTEDYDHDFLEDGGAPPLVYTNAPTLAASHCVVVVGGSMRITEGGID
jgi:hypothetical protein